MWICLAEEVYELQEAIVSKDTVHIAEEIGDVLFQLLFIVEILQERKGLTFEDIVRDVARKMIRRHPHVYANAEISDERELNRQWEAIKALEKQADGRREKQSAMDGVPAGMPALTRALKVSQRAVDQGFDWEDIHGVLDTVRDEIREFEEAMRQEAFQDMTMEWGDILFSMVNVARMVGFHPETALAGSTAKFESRFRLMEKELRKDGVNLQQLSAGEREDYWQKAKRLDHT